MKYSVTHKKCQLNNSTIFFCYKILSKSKRGAGVREEVGEQSVYKQGTINNEPKEP